MTMIPTTISTDERIFKILTYDNDYILCNVSTAKELLKNDMIQKLWHLWNYEFKVYGKDKLKQM